MLHSEKFEIEERRKKVRRMLAHSMTQEEVADALDKSRMTISRDVAAIKRESNSFIYGLAKSDLAFYFMQCIDTMQEAERVMWISLKNGDKKKCQMAKMIIEAAQARFSIFKDGPSIMSIKAMEERLAYLEQSRQGNQGLQKEIDREI